jgi:hypothetical protein
MKPCATFTMYGSSNGYQRRTAACPWMTFA